MEWGQLLLVFQLNATQFQMGAAGAVMEKLKQLLFVGLVKSTFPQSWVLVVFVTFQHDFDTEPLSGGLKCFHGLLQGEAVCNQGLHIYTL